MTSSTVIWGEDVGLAVPKSHLAYHCSHCHFPLSLAAGLSIVKYLFDTGLDNLAAIPVPELYFFQYQIRFNNTKITLHITVQLLPSKEKAVQRPGGKKQSNYLHLWV